MNKEKIGFFGGCFNPPSNIHIKLAINLIKKQKLDKVIFVPVGNFYSKNDLIEFKHRYTMLKFAIGDNKNIFIDDIENQINKKLYAVDIFKIISEKYQNNEIYFIMGSDNFEKIKSWKDYEKIKDYNYIILNRNSNDISSTKIRKMIKDNKLKENTLNQEVYKYILKNNLYQ